MGNPFDQDDSLTFTLALPVDDTTLAKPFGQQMSIKAQKSCEICKQTAEKLIICLQHLN